VFGLAVRVVAHGYESLGSGWIEVAFTRNSLGRCDIGTQRMEADCFSLRYSHTRLVKRMSRTFFVNRHGCLTLCKVLLIHDFRPGSMRVGQL
jgi:hypothetical protein